jgi:type IX secretion system PorP/SprF family membrane protein
MRPLKLTFILFVAFTSFLKSQDVSFSQMYAAPLNLNPALTGAFEGKYRIGAIMRDQWRSAIESPYSTIAANIDLRFGLNQKRINQDAFGVGVMFMNDRSSELNFTINQIAVSGGFHKSLNTDNTKYLSGGFQIALAQRSINFNKLTFQDQFNGETGYTNPTSENFPRNNIAYSDIHTGINYSSAFAKKSFYTVGLAIHHLTKPNISFYREQLTGILSEPLHRRYSLQTNVQFPIAENVLLSPRGTISIQGPHQDAVLGANLRFKTSNYSSTAIHVGSWTRVARDISTSARLDAITILGGLEVNNILIGLSYDLNPTEIARIGNPRNSFEISITYLGEYEDINVLCPKF